MFEVPILYIIFNRLDTVKESFPVIKRQKPKFLFIAADGPRPDKPGEEAKCKVVRDWVLSQIDWECELKTQFRNENLGCGKGPATAITWFFDNVERGIILEDDCVPSDSFFPYCKELLEYYKDDTRIWQISATNRLGNSSFNDYDYFFLNYSSEWGWATWKRCWKVYDFNMPLWNETYIKSQIKDLFGSCYSQMATIFDQTVNNESVTWWDYQWGFVKHINSGLSITPCKNLVSNIGFGDDATHTFGYESPLYNMTKFDLAFPMKHPVNIYKTTDLEKELLDFHFPPPKPIPKYKQTLIYKCLKKIYRAFREKK